jgi:very-short-patch-repair endonuclease
LYEYTDLEKIISDMLDSRGVEYACQYPTTSGFVLDFVLSPDIVIEVDGPCHDSSKSRKRDSFRTKVLKTEGWKIFRLNYTIFDKLDVLNTKLDEIISYSLKS